jgi:hypothetical protein
MKTDVTDIAERYRGTLRHIWNACIWVDPNSRNWDSVYSFRELKLPLFKALVNGPLRLQSHEQTFGQGFEVAPRTTDGLSMIHVNTRVPSKPDEGIWEVLNGPFRAEDVRLRPVDLFDWSPLCYIDLRYFVVEIERLGRYPDKVGQHGLVDVAECLVFWEGHIK